MNVYSTLRERGFIEQATHDSELRKYLEEEQATCYIGFDPTASSLHVGSLVPIMSLVHMQRHGHRPIALVGGGTGLIGDPSGKTEMRKMLTMADIEENANGLKQQLSRFLDFSENKALLLNNADWLVPLAYIPFLRDIGRYFSVNRMIKAESCKLRLDSEDGLSFIEFNYMVLQAYDFLELYATHDCRLQMGGNDQWGNIVAGIDLIRRKQQGSAFGITFPLITTAGGAKMGKTAKGAVWLDAKRTSPYDYYQFWINTDDRDVARFLALFTLLPMSEIKAVEELQGADLNSAKAVLAFEATCLAHGEDEAISAFQDAIKQFGAWMVPMEMLISSTIPREKTDGIDKAVASGNAVLGAEVVGTMPHTFINERELAKGIPAFKIFHLAGLATSGSAARRLIEQGGAYINDSRLKSYEIMINKNDFIDGKLLLRAGKKRYHKVVLKK
ncbi:MAG: tyrosine--tRNA ligase [Thermodesulfobacteriota bacterium]|nr:tyrosine--tRNA ligase [Thermodesulfobacteriota bacterium]